MTRIGVNSIFSCWMILIGGLRCSMVLVTVSVSVACGLDFVYQCMSL
jgi:hypothetical protein